MPLFESDQSIEAKVLYRKNSKIDKSLYPNWIDDKLHVSTEDNLPKVLAAASKLYQEKATRLFALPLAQESSGLALQYRQITDKAGGLCLPLLENENIIDFSPLIQEIVQIVSYEHAGKDLAALPAPQTKQLENLREKLKHLNKNTL